MDPSCLPASELGVLYSLCYELPKYFKSEIAMTAIFRVYDVDGHFSVIPSDVTEFCGISPDLLEQVKTKPEEVHLFGTKMSSTGGDSETPCDIDVESSEDEESDSSSSEEDESDSSEDDMDSSGCDDDDNMDSSDELLYCVRRPAHRPRRALPGRSRSRSASPQRSS